MQLVVHVLNIRLFVIIVRGMKKLPPMKDKNKQIHMKRLYVTGMV